MPLFLQQTNILKVQMLSRFFRLLYICNVDLEMRF